MRFSQIVSVGNGAMLIVLSALITFCSIKVYKILSSGPLYTEADINRDVGRNYLYEKDMEEKEKARLAKRA